MRIAEGIFTVLAILFATMGILRLEFYNITYPLMMLSLATLHLIKAIECRKKGRKIEFFLLLGTAVFVYLVIIYIVLIG